MFNWGFVGSVGISVKVASELVGSEEQRVAAVYSRNFKHCEKFAKKFNCKPCKSFEEMLNDPEIDGIYIATPHYYHFRYSKMALEKHKPVLCEKPLNLNLKSSEILFDLAKQNNTYFCEAMWTWFNPTANQVKKWIDEGKIGKCDRERLRILRDVDLHIPPAAVLSTIAPRRVDVRAKGEAVQHSALKQCTVQQ